MYRIDNMITIENQNPYKINLLFSELRKYLKRTY